MKLVHSYTSLKQYAQCPAQYHAVRIERSVKKVQGAEAKEGDEVHKALENYAKHDVPLPTYAVMYKQAVDTIKETYKGDVYYEHKFAFDADLNKVPYGSKQRKYIGAADVLIVQGSKAVVIDYKTGKDKYPDTKQLALMAMFTMAEFPEVVEVLGVLNFLKTGRLVHKEYKRSEIMQEVMDVVATIDALEHSVVSGDWPAKASALCPWCPVTNCPNWREPPLKKRLYYEPE